MIRFGDGSRSSSADRHNCAAVIGASTEAAFAASRTTTDASNLRPSQNHP
jgi:hypothetical protein